MTATIIHLDDYRNPLARTQRYYNLTMGFFCGALTLAWLYAIWCWL